MKKTVIDPVGEVRCPRCGARNSFTAKRTGKGKVTGLVLAGPIGLAAAPKRLNCNGCGANLKRGGSPRPELSPQARGYVTAAIVVLVLLVWLLSKI